MNDLAKFQKEEINSYMAVIPETKEEKRIAYNSAMNPTGRVNDIINETIALVNYYLERVEMKDRDDAANVVEGVRVILIDQNGASYQCVSIGIMQSLMRLESLFGPAATWEEPIPVKVKQVSLGKNSMLTLEMV